jgi:hypothetical protein
MSTTDTTTNHTTTKAGRVVALSALLAGYQTTQRAILREPHGTDLDAARRAERLALIGARITGVWRLITAHAVTDHTIPAVYLRAAVIAEGDARDNARFWRDTARDWRARAEHRPTSDAAGALSNWHELGVTA